MNKNKSNFKEQLIKFKSYLKAYENISNNTINSYLITLKQYEKYLLASKLYYLDIKNVDAEKFIIFLSNNNNQATLNSKIFALRKFYEYLYLVGEVNNKYFKLIKTKSIKQTKKAKNYIIFSESEFEKIKDLISKNSSQKFKLRNILIIEILFYSGIRVSELINIKISDFNYNFNTCCVFGKGNKQNIIYLNKNVKHTLNEYIKIKKIKLNSTQFLFTNSREKQLTRQGINHMLKKTLSMVYPNISPHSFRYTFASNLFKTTDSMQITRNMLKHCSTDTTQIYLNFDVDLLARKVSEINEKLVGEFECQCLI